MGGISGADTLQLYRRLGLGAGAFPGWDAAKSLVTRQEWKYERDGMVISLQGWIYGHDRPMIGSDPIRTCPRLCGILSFLVYMFIERR